MDIQKEMVCLLGKHYNDNVLVCSLIDNIYYYSFLEHEAEIKDYIAIIQLVDQGLISLPAGWETDLINDFPCRKVTLTDKGIKQYLEYVVRPQDIEMLEKIFQDNLELKVTAADVKEALETKNNSQAGIKISPLREKNLIEADPKGTYYLSQLGKELMKNLMLSTA